MPSIRTGSATLLDAGTYKVGSLPPEGNGYVEWHEWAAAQHKAGLRQCECAKCGLWKYPQELSDQTTEHIATNRKGMKVRVIGAVCTKCAAMLPNAAFSGHEHEDSK